MNGVAEVTHDTIKHPCTYNQSSRTCPKVSSAASGLARNSATNNGWYWTSMLHGITGTWKTMACGSYAVAELAPGRWRLRCGTYKVESEYGPNQVSKTFTTIYMCPNKDSKTGKEQVAEKLIQTSATGYEGSTKEGSYNLDFNVAAGKQWMHIYFAGESQNAVSVGNWNHRHLNLSKIG
jgi:hypothetical protein